MMTAANTTIEARRAASAWRWQQHSFRAMNTAVHAWLYSPKSRPFARDVEEVFHYFEGLLSRFRPTSELSAMNEYAGDVFYASPDFYSAVEAALWAAQQTGGLYDPTILDCLEAAGYDRTFQAIRDRTPLQAGEDPVAIDDAAPSQPRRYDYRQVQLDGFTRTIARPPRLRLDLGGMGKGWTVDRLADELLDAGHFLINAGGDLYAYGAPNGGHGWRVELTHPFDPALSYATLLVDHHAVATSTVARRRWLQGGSVRHHLIDPRTGRPAATDAVSVSVVGPRAFTAEVHAKAALILGAADGLAYLESLPDLEGAVFVADGSVRMTSGMQVYLEHCDPAGYRPAAMGA